MDFLLAWKVLLDVHLQSSKHERSQQSVDLTNHLLLLFRIIFFCISHGEQVVEILNRIKKSRHQKVEKGPQFFQAVL